MGVVGAGSGGMGGELSSFSSRRGVVVVVDVVIVARSCLFIGQSSRKMFLVSVFFGVGTRIWCAVVGGTRPTLVGGTLPCVVLRVYLGVPPFRRAVYLVCVMFPLCP